MFFGLSFLTGCFFWAVSCVRDCSGALFYFIFGGLGGCCIPENKIKKAGTESPTRRCEEERRSKQGARPNAAFVFKNNVVFYVKIKKQICKPDSVHTIKCYLIIYLALQLLARSSCLPFGNGREALGNRYTWHFTA
jgi:hypothetical protein